ncbi:hypothetical protein DFP94_101284 [Fontibacillus phaseoli]|uniref:Uncharacterized protein n=1 Tax=Fontibacillus phaseoli TaxID=1416533 RepID=A0A369BMC6_9BACL|nr:hypothetical protein [Fontibacillus phaseoli]RCX22703.1 hypothetical protein DFP94_101284 [Fontibacillus phaseoli]
MNAAKKKVQGNENYSPRSKPPIMKMMEEASRRTEKEICVEQVNVNCSIVDRAETLIVGFGLPINYESRGYNFSTDDFSSRSLTDSIYARKVISEGDIDFLAEIIGIDLADKEIVSARYDIAGDGNYKVVVGIEVDSLEHLPEYLPENTITLTVPAGRFAKMLINEHKKEGRTGYEERMHADVYFVEEFRHETKYVYDQNSYPLNTYDLSGEMLTKYEPVKIPANESERFDSLRYKIVSLPEMKIACSMTPPDSEEFVITKYFEVEHQVFATEAAKYYIHDYYGFPSNSDMEGKVNRCFGTRVSSFDGMPDSVHQILLPGGIYLHITQLEFNGDNPSIPYDVAFNHLEELFLSRHPGYERDWSRHVIARFRQANCASVFVPLILKP